MPTISQYAQSVAEPTGLTRTLGEFHAERDNYGEVRIRTGNTASVFRVNSRGKDMMIKCYVRRRVDLSAIYDYISHSGDILFPSLELLPEELYVFDAFGEGAYFDILTGEWIHGTTLDTEIKRACNEGDSERMKVLSQSFDKLALELLRRPWAHGDLKPENIIVSHEGKLQLVDFDALYFPENPSPSYCEMGTPGYQHPMRDSRLYDKSIDDYPIALISVSLAVLALDTTLYGEFNSSDIIILNPSEILDGRSAAYGIVKRVLAEAGDYGHYRFALTLQSQSVALQGMEDVLRRILNPCPKLKADAVFMDNGLFGYRDQSAEQVIIEPVFEEATGFREGAALVSLEKKHRLISDEGLFLFPELNYEDIKPLSGGYAAFRRDSKWGYVNRHGEVVIEPCYEAAGSMHHGFAAVKRNKKWGYIDAMGNCVADFVFEKAFGYRDGHAMAFSGGKIIKIDLKNNIKG